MIAVKHPSVLNDWQLFRQAKLLVKHTSRASNPDWYRQARQLDRQWHIWVDGYDVVSAVFDKRSGQWHEGPEPVLPRDTGTSVGSQKPLSKDVVHGLHQSLNESQLEAIFANFDEDGLRKLHETLSRLVQGKDIGGKVKSLGVILHMADEFGIADLAPEYSADTDFKGVSELLVMDAQEALGDLTADTVGNSWRSLPYWGVKEGERRSIAIQMSRRFQSLFFELDRYSQSRNIPVIAAACAAPLEALRLAPFLLDSEAPRGSGDIVVFQYRRFSTLAVIDPDGELVLLRSLPHRMGQDHPYSLGEILTNTAASVGYTDPTVTIAAMSNLNQDALASDLSHFFADRPPMNIGLVSPGEIEAFSKLGKARLEMALGDAALIHSLEEKAPLSRSVTFRELGKDWASQNFFGISEEEREIYPPQKDLRLLRFFSNSRWLAGFALIGLAAWTGFEFVTTATTDAWSLPDGEAGSASVELQKLSKDRSRFEYWENLMARRSEGWLAMEVLVQLFKPDSGLVVSESRYRTEAFSETTPSKDASKANGKLGFSRIWIIKGFSRAEGASYLSKLSSNSFLGERFEEMAKDYSALSLQGAGDTRRLEVTMQQKQGQMPPTKRFPLSVARHYRNSFEITITQTFTEKDSLALTTKPPVLAPAEPATGQSMAATEPKP